MKFCLVDFLLVEGLTGNNSHPFSAFEGTIQNEDFLLADCKYKKLNQAMEAIYTNRFISAFWNSNYAEANKWYQLAASLPSSKMPKIQLIYRTFYHGLMAFQMFRDGEGEEWLDKGKVALDKMEQWAKNSNVIFESKLYLLESEHYASMCNIVAAKESFELSAQTARDHGLIHEQGLAYECMGKFLSSVVDIGAPKWLQKAHTCYMQWGATAKAKQLQKDHNLELPDESIRVSLKHDRNDGEEGLV